MPSSRGYSQPRDRTQVSCIVGGFFTVWAPREALVLNPFHTTTIVSSYMLFNLNPLQVHWLFSGRPLLDTDIGNMVINHTVVISHYSHYKVPWGRQGVVLNPQEKCKAKSWALPSLCLILPICRMGLLKVVPSYTLMEVHCDKAWGSFAAWKEQWQQKCTESRGWTHFSRSREQRTTLKLWMPVSKACWSKLRKGEGHPGGKDSAASKREGEWGGVGHFFMIPSQAGLLSG